MESTDLYTILLEHAGNTFVAQFRAGNVDDARSEWARKILAGSDFNIPIGVCKELAESVAEDDPVLLDGMCNVWCCTASGGGHLGLLHLIKTRDGDADGPTISLTDM